MSISWNEVRGRALVFSREWASATAEEPDKQTFWNDFFNVFGVPRRSVAVFEHAVARTGGSYGYIDLFWPGMLLAEHKSRGSSLDRAESQAFSYVEDLITQGHHDEVPRFVVVCDFERFALFDLEPESSDITLPLFRDGRAYRVTEFSLRDLHKHVRSFAFIRGETPAKLDPEDPANFKATNLLAGLHDAIEATGYTGPPLERTLVRILFCLFAEDTGIFEPGSFTAFVDRSRADGRDLGPLLSELWGVLDTPDNSRQSTLDEDLASFPHVNGGLFAEHLPTCAYNSEMRERLLECCRFQWARISPAVFGALFQNILDHVNRRQLGAHYTSERDILKLLRALFLDDLQAELAAAKADRSTGRRNRLREFQQKLRRLRFLDPACGCGNFLVLAYREVRRLENEALIASLTKRGALQRELDIKALAQVDVDQFYGLELNEWAVRIAEVGLWLTDHQANVELAEALGQTYRRLPLRASPTVRIDNALRVDWRSLLPPSSDVLVLGNPPFVGKKEQDQSQREDMDHVWADTSGSGNLDYVTCWYRKVVDYIQGHPGLRCAFVSTNSITQGEQAGILWSALFSRSRIKIQFAHRTFAWISEARGRAHVHVVIIGFGLADPPRKQIYEYPTPTDPPVVTVVTNISPYLVEGSDTVVTARKRPINGAPPINYGSMMIDKSRSAGDDEGLILAPSHRNALITETPGLAPFVRRLYGGKEFLNGTERWCLWLVDAPPSLIRQSALLRKRLDAIRTFRQSSGRAQTVRLAVTPSLFGEIRQPKSNYLLIPKVSSENRSYLPIGFMDPEDIASGSALVVPDPTLYDFGVLSSAMHNAWMRCVAGRLKSDYQYSNTIVYNNFPWPEKVSDKARTAVSDAAHSVLDARMAHGSSTLADLYDPTSMPSNLATTHAALDRAVDRCYRPKSFASERERVEYLLRLFEQLVRPLTPAPSRVKRRGLRRSASHKS